MFVLYLFLKLVFRFPYAVVNSRTRIRLFGYGSQLYLIKNLGEHFLKIVLY